MPRYVRNTLILAKVETTAGTDATPTGAADAVLVSDVTITPLEAQNVDRNVIRGFFGASEQLVATNYLKVAFTVELAGAGTAGGVPQWGDLLIGCAHAESALTTPPRTEYTPLSTNLKTLTIYVYDDGVLHKLLGAMGTVTLSAKAGERPTLSFEFTGLNGGISAATATGTFTAWKTPPTMAKANVTDVTFGGTYAAGAVTGGTVYPSTGLELDWGLAVGFTPLLSSETVDVTDRQVSGKVQLDLSASQEVSFMSDVLANTLRSLSLVIGTTAGNKILLYAPAVQLANPRKEELNGRRLIGYDLRVTPVSGNDEIRLVCL